MFYRFLKLWNALRLCLYCHNKPVSFKFNLYSYLSNKENITDCWRQLQQWRKKVTLRVVGDNSNNGGG